MSLTAELKAEIASVIGKTTDERQAEVAATIRFAGGLHRVANHLIIEAELDSLAGANRLQKELLDLYRAKSELVVVNSSSRKNERYVVRVVHQTEQLARITGLIDPKGRPIRGLPPQIVSGRQSAAVAAWRGAFMARGSLMEPGRSAAMEISCPGAETALALVGTARRLGALAKSREVRGVDRVLVRDGDHISLLLEVMECPKTKALWEERRKEREMRGSVNRLANFDDANIRRSARAAVAAGARVARAFEILGSDIPEHLKSAGELRLAYKEASLEELGQKSTPQLTKDAVAGRIRRLLAMADKQAQEQGIPDTSSVLTPDMLDE
ncbi:DNA-binding protein WhiA [Boudabousia liubingyangii]|uniref:DNA-binding protein WhiA n=1 Tax=Boudabousia liubingyangii TaxID=1921764 RepID=UPI00093BBD2A|nr:DNA-binding protein WhiA [Boudabousia liubingyangii]OKL47659.1 DNA-binding protein WhiA [Boudabousia liubingyangii]